MNITTAVDYFYVNNLKYGIKYSHIHKPGKKNNNFFKKFITVAKSLQNKT